MRLRLTEDPKEWRKAAWFGALGFALLSSVLRWRRVLPQPAWLVILAILACIAVAACFWPRAFRGWYRLSGRLSHAMVEVIGCVALTLFFWIILTPVALIMRATGKDPLRTKRSNPASYWTESRESSPLDRIF